MEVDYGDEVEAEQMVHMGQYDAEFGQWTEGWSTNC